MSMRIVMAGVLTLGAGITATAPAHAKDVLIRGARVHTAGDAGTLENSDVRVRGGRIVAVGKGLPVEAGVEVVETTGRPLTPGLFAGISNIGLSEVMDDDNEFNLNLSALAHDQRWRPEFDVGLAFNPRSVVVPVTRMEGITWTVLAPVVEDSILAGQAWPSPWTAATTRNCPVAARCSSTGPGHPRRTAAPARGSSCCSSGRCARPG